MATVHDQYVAVVDEVSYGTAILPTKAFEFQSEGVEGKYERIDSESVRAGSKALRSDRFAVNAKGAEGELKMEFLSGGFDFWLKHMFGAVSTGAPAGGFTTHTATLGTLNGKSFTAQVGRATNAGVLEAFTYEGGKVKDWELSNSVDELLNLSVSCDFAKETIGAGTGAYAAVTPVYVANTKLFSFNSASITVGGTTFPVSEFSVKGDNSLKTDRYFLSNGGKKSEPLEEGLRKYEWSAKGEFTDKVILQKIASSIASGAVAAISVTWDGPDLTQVKVDIPFARFDEGPVTVGGLEVLSQDLSGIAMTDGTASPVTVTYKALT